MGVLFDRVRVIRAYVAEAARYGFPARRESRNRDVVFLVDGVGGLQAGPLMARRALRAAGLELTTVLFAWQYGLPGEIWTDLMWLRRNRVKAVGLARALSAYHREHPEASIHLVAFSAGCGIAVFALEHLASRWSLKTLVMACPALSPQYNLSRALGGVQRAIALISDRDTFILGLGTRVFGTIDRVHTFAAGRAGFTPPPGLNEREREAYARLRQIPWTPEMAVLGHHGGHTGWASPALLSRYLPEWLGERAEAAVHPDRSRRSASAAQP